MEFSGIKDLRQFAVNLSQKVAMIGEKELAEDLKNWSKTFFTTSSEMLGELNLILGRVINLSLLDEVTYHDIEDCINAINKVFGLY